jgi:Fe2+ or Zn2+ uptake regulation protein
MQIAAACTRCIELERLRYTRKSMRDTLLTLIARHDFISAIDIREALEMNENESRALYRFLERFQDEGLVEKIGSGIGAVYRSVTRKRRAA